MDSRDFCGRKAVSGHFPDYGAIFMSNRTTFRECMKKSLLGLPDAFSSFVERVKAGMILFLFEFEERKLYGVFGAISDGGMNIVPDAYISSGKSFPAQVKISTIWHCDPLFEDEFCDAIRENYFCRNKFHFGLSKDQVENLLWLFGSRKVKIPHSPHHTKRKKRKQDHMSVEDGLGNFEIQISRQKPAMDHDISVISEREEESLPLSSDSCRKTESVHFDVNAYDPEHPGFHQPEGPRTHSAAGHESNDLLALQQKEGNFHTSSEETDDYIPLFSPDRSDPEEEVFDVSEWSVEKQIDISIPVPQLPLMPILSDEGSNHLKALPTNGMYSDKSKKRASVFSRLNFLSKYTASENQNDASGKKLENDTLRVKQQCRVECETMRKVTQQKHGDEDCILYERTSVFLRLTGAPDAVSQQVHCMPALNKEAGKWRKKGKKRSSSSKWTRYKVDKFLNQSQKMLASEFDVEADCYREDMSVPEILEKLLQRHANWEDYGGKI